MSLINYTYIDNSTFIIAQFLQAKVIQFGEIIIMGKRDALAQSPAWDDTFCL